jgi:S1-C subfamily serine protease
MAARIPLLVCALALAVTGCASSGTRGKDSQPAPVGSAPATEMPATAVASRVRLGVHCTQVTPELAQTDHLPVDIGVRVVSVETGSIAEAGGIQVGDLILKYGDLSLYQISDLTAAIAATTKGADVPITVWRPTGEAVLDVQF